MGITLQDYFDKAKLGLPVSFAPFIEMKYEPFATQVSGLNAVLRNERYGLYDDPAAGKTMVSHAAALYWASEGYRTVAVMPPALLDQYYEEFHEIFIGVERYVDMHILRASPDKRRKWYEEWDNRKEGWPRILTMSYQIFLKEHKLLIEKGYQILFLDEAQNLKDCTSQVYHAVKDFVEQKKGASVCLMSGSIIHNEMIDAYSPISLTNPDAYASFQQFDRKHSVYRKFRLKTPRRAKNGKVFRTFKQRVGYIGIDKINVNLYKYGRRVLKKDVFEIQDPTISEVPITLDPKHLKLYKKLVKERILELKDRLVVAVNEQALRQQALQIITCPELYVDGPLPFKNNIVEGVRTLIDSVTTQTKVIVFVNYQNSVETMAKHFEGMNPAVMYGPANNEKGRKKFLNDPTCRLLVAHPKSAGVGLNLQHVCHTIIFAEPTGVPGDFKQAMDRVVRKGQQNLVNVYILKAKGTIAPRATKEMRRKEGEIRAVHKDWYSFLDVFQAA